MRILFVCGGTAGHINPALAVADELIQKYPQAKVLFAGNPKGMEARLVPKAGYSFEPIRVAGLQRKITAKNIVRNVEAAYLLLKSTPTAKKIISEFNPDVVVGTGGYVSAPIVKTAQKMGIKTVIHEQNAFPGIANKMLCTHADKILLAVESAKEHIKADENKIAVTGNPVRSSVCLATRENARKELGISNEKICILSFGGSLGASRINQSVAELIKELHPAGTVHHIHAAGSYDYNDFKAALKGFMPDYENDSSLDIREYIDNMATCLAAADLVICRAGAITITELQCAGKASILIPSPNVAENHQYYNAMELVNKNAARILEENELSGQSLTRLVKHLISNPEDLFRLGLNAKSMAIMDANQRILKEIISLLD